MKINISVGSLVAIQILFAFLTQILIIREVGVGAETDSYIAALVVPATLMAILTTVVQVVWLPKLAIIDKYDSQRYKQLSTAKTQAWILVFLIYLLLYASNKIWIPGLFPGLNPSQLELTGSLLSPIFLASSINTLSAVFSIFLRSEDRFIASEFAPTFGTVFSLLLIALYLPSYGLLAVVWISVFRAVIVYFVLSCLTKRVGLNLVLGIKTKETWRQMSPIFYSALLYKSSPLVDRYWATQGSVGTITIFNLATLVVSALITIMEKSLCSVLFPEIARLVNEKNFKAVRVILLRKNLQFLLFCLGLAVSIMLIAPYTYDLVYVALHLDRTFYELLTTLVLVLIAQLYFTLSAAISMGVFSAFHNTSTPAIVGALSFVFGMIIKSIFFKISGIIGIALAISLTTFMIAATYMYILFNKFRIECA